MNPTSHKTFEQPIKLDKSSIKWPEIISLGMLNAAVAISWIAYLEYQPQILSKFGLENLSGWLIISKALILVLIPALSGWLADRNLNRNGRFFTIYLAGINGTAMIFMIVATIAGFGPESALSAILPVMIILWLIGMATFLAPAYSMLSSFADKRKLPIAMGVIILITDLIYALEPLVINLVLILGETLTFVTGGLLVFGAGYLFYRQSADEVTDRIQRTSSARDTRSEWRVVISIAAFLGIGRAFLVEYIPWQSPIENISGKELSFMLLGLSAIVAFLCSRMVIRAGIRKVINYSALVMFLGISIILVCSPNGLLFFTGSLLLSLAFALLNVSGLPYLFTRISARHSTFAIGVFLGITALFEGLLEIMTGFM